MIRAALRTLAILCGLLPLPAFAQSACPYIAFNAVLTPAQWQACFEAKSDAAVGGYLPLQGGTMIGTLVTATPTVASVGLVLPHGVAPTTPTNGAMWTTVAGLFVQINGVTIGPLTEGAGGSFAATPPLAVTFPSSVVTYGLNYDANFGLNGSNALAFANCNVNTALAGPSSGSAGEPGCRALVGADLPLPGASSLGGIESYAAVSHQWINAISTSGVPSSTQPAFSDLSGSLSPTQCPAALAAVLGCVELGGSTLSVNGSGGLSLNLANANSWSALQTFGTGDLAINGGSATAGLATVTSGGVISSTGAGTGVLTALGNAVNGTGGMLTYGIIGTSGATIPLLNGNNTWSGTNAFDIETATSLALGGCTIGSNILCLNGFTQGEIPYIGANGGVLGSTSVLFLDPAYSNTLGIGSAAPYTDNNNALGGVIRRDNSGPNRFSIVNQSTNAAASSQLDLNLGAPTGANFTMGLSTVGGQVYGTLAVDSVPVQMAFAAPDFAWENSAQTTSFAELNSTFFKVYNTTAATNTVTGSGIFAGGVGVAGDLFVGGTTSGITLLTSFIGAAQISSENASSNSGAVAYLQAVMSNVPNAYAYLGVANGTTPIGELEVGSGISSFIMAMNSVTIETLTKGGGVQIGAPTGSDCGAGCLNAGALKVNNVAVVTSANSNTWTALQIYNPNEFELVGGTSGALKQNCAAICGTNTITWPAGTTDFSGTGPGVLQQASSGDAFTVGAVNLASSDFVTGTLPNANGGFTQTQLGTYSPTIACSTAGNATFTVNSARYQTNGKWTLVSLDITVASNTTGSGTVNVSAPATIKSAGGLAGKEIASTGVGITAGFQGSATTFNFSTDAGLGVCTAGYELVASGVYENQ